MKEKNNKDNKENKYNSVVDEFKRHKRLNKKIKIKAKELKREKEKFWDITLVMFKKTFKIKRQLELGLEFGLKTGAFHSQYTITTFNSEKKVLQIEWKNGEDKYSLSFALKSKLFNRSTYYVKVVENVYKNTPFWGLQDTMGLLLLKSNFKKQVKTFKKAIMHVWDNLQEYEDDLKNI